MIGFRIRRRERTVSEAHVREFLGLPVANVSDCMQRMFAGGPRLRPMHDGTPMAGPALTVRTRPGDNLMIHKALHMAQPGDVIVVDGGGDLSNALIGELMVATAQRRGLAGMVLYGAVRDARSLREGCFPVFAAGVTHRGPYKDGPGEINVPVAVGGMVVSPGDLVIGDDDGVLAVALDQVPAVLKAAQDKARLEASMMQAIRDGTQNIDWIDASLRARGCVIED